jgi:hypothetical protein
MDRVATGSAVERVTHRALAAWIRFVAPTATGLPNWRVLLIVPATATLITAVLIALQWSGTSSGVHWLSLGSGSDPRLVFGVPRPIRSDEWLVQQSWVVSQANTGFGEINGMFPGGSDATVLSELPTWNWSSLFRPHLWGYLFFGLDVGVAWHWWVPALVMGIGCYTFVVTMLPTRVLAGAALALGAYFTPLLQWFYTPSSVMPVAWAFLALTATIWVYRDPRAWVRVVWSAVVGYFAITMAMGLYVPFILPSIYVFVAFAIGYALRVRPWRSEPGWATVRRVLPFVVAGAVAATVTLIWVFSRASTFDAIQSTVYPGQRSLPTGALLMNDPHLAGIAGAPWNKALQSQGASILGGNASEGSSVLLLALFVLPGVLWLIVRSVRRSSVDWVLVAMVGYLLVIVAYLLVPGWDGLAHLLQLDRIAPERFRIAFVVLLPVFAVLVIDAADRDPSTRNWAPATLSALFTAGVLGLLYWRIKTIDPDVLGMATGWKIVVVLVILAVFLLFLRRLATLATIFLLVTALLLSWGVNPVYRGIFDLSETQVGDEVQEIDEEDPGTWVAVGSAESMAVLMQSGVESYSGVQNYPSMEMWREIDPTGRYEGSWNRLAHIRWIVQGGPPRVTSPWGDVVEVTLDPCSDFAQENVDYVLSDQGAISNPCLTELASVQQGNLAMAIYEVSAAR